MSKDKKNWLKDNFSYLILIFLFGSLVGFIYEELFYLIVDKKIVYQGFLYGPYLPIYGWGCLGLLSLKKVKKHPSLVFLLAILITGVLEYISGFMLLKIFNRTWWDYTGLFLNINGHVCLRSVLSFSVGGLALIYLIEPWVLKINDKIKAKTKSIVYITIIAIMLLDLSFCLIIRHPVKI